MSNLKEYIVSLHSHNDLDGFYNDLENTGTGTHGVLPDRNVECSLRRPISRNTNYLLSEEEANLIKQDPRVLDVELHPKERGIEIRSRWTQTSTQWTKSQTVTSGNKNWGLLRTYEGAQRTDWGYDGGAPVQSGTINATASGKNVDVIVCDGHIDPAHPEFAVNADGTGGSRVIQFNWLSLNPQVLNTAPGTYVYPPYVYADAQIMADNNHGNHVAGTIAGNTQGWARDANIYNIKPYSTSDNPIYQLTSVADHIFDYIRAWHNQKAVNPVTGIKNPTIVNCSWGFTLVVPYTQISYVVYRGVVHTGPFTIPQLNNYGVSVDADNNAELEVRITATEVDVEDCANDGIIIVGAAGNSQSKADIPSGVDYNNYIIVPIGSYNYAVFYHQGMSPGGSTSAICVGSCNASVVSGGDRKSYFSNSGPRIDIWAPGDVIMSAHLTSGASDTRNTNYYQNILSGTSMASAMTTGLMAAVLETYPRYKSTDLKAYLEFYSKTGQIPSSSGGYTDTHDLQGAPNRYLTYHEERPATGNAYPKNNFNPRPSTGQAWPRTKIYKYGH